MSELILLERARKIYKQLHLPLKNYPQYEKFVTVQQIRKSFIDFITEVQIANKVPSLRNKNLQLADANLEQIKFLLNLSFDFKYISKGLHRDVMYKLDEVGRLLGGFIKMKPKSKEQKEETEQNREVL